MNQKLLASFDNEMTATRLEQDLAASGINCVVQEEIKTYDVLIDLNRGGSCFALYVDEKDYTKAKEVFEQFNKTRDEENPWCPKCGSDDVTRTKVHHPHGPKWLWYVFDSAIAAHFYFQEYDEENCHCNSCGHDFKRH